MSGYALARIRFKGRKVLFNLVLPDYDDSFPDNDDSPVLQIFKMGLLNTFADRSCPG